MEILWVLDNMENFDYWEFEEIWELPDSPIFKIFSPEIFWAKIEKKE